MRRMTLTADQRTVPCTADGTSHTSVVATNPGQPRALSSKRKWSERMKCLFSKLAQVLQAITNFTNTLECSRLGLDALSQTVERSAELPTEKPFAQSLP